MTQQQRPENRVTTRVSRGVQYFSGSFRDDVSHKRTGRPVDTYGQPTSGEVTDQPSPTLARPCDPTSEEASS